MESAPRPKVVHLIAQAPCYAVIIIISKLTGKFNKGDVPVERIEEAT